MTNIDTSTIICEAITYFAKWLNISSFLEEGRVVIRLEDNLGVGQTYGLCTPNHATAFDVISVNLAIKSTPSVSGMLECLAHEMCHAAQLLKKELYFISTTTDKFFFFKIPSVKKMHKGIDITHIDYHEDPSEIEARKVQLLLTSAFWSIKFKEFNETEFPSLNLQHYSEINEAIQRHLKSIPLNHTADNERTAIIDGVIYKAIISADGKFASIYNIVSSNEADFCGRFVIEGVNLIEIYPMSGDRAVIGILK